MDFVKAIDNLPVWVKIVLSLPFLDFIWGIYRIVKGACKNDNVLILVGILWIVPGATVCWVLDIIFNAMYGHPVLA